MDAGGGGEPRLTLDECARPLGSFAGLAHHDDVPHPGFPCTYCHLGAVRIVCRIAEVAVGIHEHGQGAVWVRRWLVETGWSFFRVPRMCAAGYFSSIHMSNGLAM